jgi:hypothetical protein
MKYIFKKYEFDSQSQAESRINALPSVQDEDGNDQPSHSHTVVKLGYLWTVEPTYNEEGEVETEGTQSDKYSVDVLWKSSEITETDEDGNSTVQYPYGWSSKEIDIEDNGVHTFAGWNFKE